ncbi:hypothetical protein SEVIR_9G043401v4 [Setaria viridis]
MYFCFGMALMPCTRLLAMGVLGNVFIVHGEYEDWEEYRKTCSTLEGDQASVQLWERLLSNTKLIEFFLTDNSCELLKIESVAFYHALKIAAELSCLFKALIHFGFTVILSHINLVGIANDDGI